MSGCYTSKVLGWTALVSKDLNPYERYTPTTKYESFEVVGKKVNFYQKNSNCRGEKRMKERARIVHTAAGS